MKEDMVENAQDWRFCTIQSQEQGNWYSESRMEAWLVCYAKVRRIMMNDN